MLLELLLNIKSCIAALGIKTKNILPLLLFMPIMFRFIQGRRGKNIATEDSHLILIII